MKVKPVENGIEIVGRDHEVPDMLEKASVYARDFGYIVDDVRFDKNWGNDREVTLTIKFDPDEEA